jgi:hypothetical protein
MEAWLLSLNPDDPSPIAAGADIIPFPPPPRPHPPASATAPAVLPVPISALSGALREAVAALAEQCAALQRTAQALAIDKAGFAEAKRRLMLEGRRAQAIAAQADRIAIAIAAGDFAGLQALQGELAQLACAAPADQPAGPPPTSARNCAP